MAKKRRGSPFSGLEDEITSLGFKRIAGVDEAGRGPLAGPVVAAACVLPMGLSKTIHLGDSKQLSPSARDESFLELVVHPSVDWAIGVIEAPEIDELNIHHATLAAMGTAVKRLKTKPDFLLVDGKFVPDVDIPGESVVGGDSSVKSIAAASILAKVIRDRIMEGYNDLYPEYGLEKHKGYGTKEHLYAIDSLGSLPIHRKTFRGTKP